MYAEMDQIHPFFSFIFGKCRGGRDLAGRAPQLESKPPKIFEVCFYLREFLGI